MSVMPEPVSRANGLDLNQVISCTAILFFVRNGARSPVWLDDGDITRLFDHFQERPLPTEVLSSGDGIQLVQGTAGMAETTAGIMGIETAARTTMGPEHQG